MRVSSRNNKHVQPTDASLSQLPRLINTPEAAKVLGRSPATLKRWRYEGTGPDWVEIEGRVRYDVAVLLEFIRKNTRVASVRAASEDSREAV
jgi:predicted site-specific integrase-resolvase